MSNILVIGAVKTTQLTLESLVKHGFNVVGVLGHEPKNVENVSGWVDLKEISRNLKVEYKGFSLINNDDNVNWAKSKKPDIIFAVGFSQLMSNKWLEMPTLGCIGFHPTKLPKGRGRAPLAWLVLEEKYGAATFFLMGEGADDGPIFIQDEFVIDVDDDASSVEKKIGDSINSALDRWLPELKKGEWRFKEQNDLEASWYGKRGAEDGFINWSLSCFTIDRLIKASTDPHPGAYFFFNDEKIVVKRSRIETKLSIKGTVGRVLLVNKENEYLIQCSDGLLWISDLFLERNVSLKVGDCLKYNVEEEIYKIKKLLKSKELI